MEAVKYEVQTFMICGGWTNCWLCNDEPEVFDSIKEAQAEIDDFFKTIQWEIDNGHRSLEEGYSRDEYRIVVSAGSRVNIIC